MKIGLGAALVLCCLSLAPAHAVSSGATYAEVRYPSTKTLCLVKRSENVRAIVATIEKFKVKAAFTPNDRMPPALIVTIVKGTDKSAYYFSQSTLYEFKENHFRMSFKGGAREGLLHEIEPIHSATNGGHDRGCRQS